MEKGGEAVLIAKMKNSIQILSSSAQGYEDMTLKRFLIARSMEPEKAAKMFVQWQKWRSEIAPLGFIHDSEVPDELASNKIYLGGPTQDEHPLLIIKACNHYPSKDQLQFKKFVVHLLDKTIASAHKGTEIGNEKLCKVTISVSYPNFYRILEKGFLSCIRKKRGIIDLQQISYRNVDARALITGFQFLQAYYPERLEKCFILHMPRFFVAIWRIVSRFLEKQTLQKIVIVTNEEEMRDFVEQVGEEALPECYGGKAKLVALQDVVLTPSS